MSRGYITIAQNSQHGDYLRAAYGLALSLRKTQAEYSRLSVMVTPGTSVPESYREVFDQVIEIPWGDMAAHRDWKIHNKWKVYHCSPYDETILLDADMLFGSDVSAYWDILARRPAYICTQPYTFRGEPIRDSRYREAFDLNHLPHVYTAFFYFRRTPAVQKYFRAVELVYREWDQIRREYIGLPQNISGDLAFGLAMKLTDTESLYTSQFGFPGIVHMKSALQQIGDNLFEDWTLHLGCQVRSDGSIYVGGYRQVMPFHYHVKTFLTDQILERLHR
jgi:hypothetical protein